MTTPDTIRTSIHDCTELIRVVRAAPPERFQMKSFYRGAGCGTSACIAGWAALDGTVRARCGPAGSTWSDCGWPAGNDEAQHICETLIPAIHEGTIWHFDSRRYIYQDHPSSRRSAVDDAPFKATEFEIEVLGEAWAGGLAECEAAINRLMIVRACLEKWLSVLGPKIAPERKYDEPQPLLASCTNR